MTLSASGELVLLAVLVTVVGAGMTSGVVVALSGAAVVARWGTTSLDAVVGAQAVLGPGALVGPPAAAASAWCAAAALVLVSPKGLGAAVFGLFAALALVGPGFTGGSGAVLRLAATAALVGVTVVAGRLAPPRARPLAVALAAAAPVLALLSR